MKINDNSAQQHIHKEQLTFCHQVDTEILPKLAEKVLITHHNVIDYLALMVFTYIDDLQQNDKQSECKVGGAYRLQETILLCRQTGSKHTSPHHNIDILS